MPELFKLNKFLGLCTRAGRDSRPVGSIDDCQNLVFNTYIGKPSVRMGYATDLTAAPADVSGQTQLASFRYLRGVAPATEVPTAQNIVVLAGTVTGPTYHYFQRPYWGKNTAVIDSANWLRWGEFDALTAAGPPFPENANTIEFSGFAVGTDDYYNGWILFNSTRSEALYVTDSGSSVLTFNEDVPSDWLVGDTYLAYRHFHDSPAYQPSWTDPIVLKVGNNIVASGGQGSTAGYKPVWSGIVNQTWFSGASRTPSFNQTYVSELELKNTNSWLDLQNAGLGAGTLTQQKRYWIGFVWETFDGQRSLMYHPSTAYIDTLALSLSLTADARIHFPLMDKRCRYLHVFMAETDTTIASPDDIDWTSWFFAQTHDLTSTGWTYTNSTTVPGYYTKTITLDSTDWNSIDSEAGDLVTFLGHTKPNRTTVSFSYGLITAGRLFVAKYYDYNAALNYNDQVNYTCFSGGGVSQWAKLMDLDDQLQTTIEAGDPSSVKNIAEWEGKLVVLKDTGSFWFDVLADPTQWILNEISRKVGCDAPDSVAVTPSGIIWAKSVDGIYLWRGGEPIELSRNWRVSTSVATGFRALSASFVVQWIGWYDPYHRSYRLMYTSDGSTKTTVYEAFLDSNEPDLGGLPIWTKHVFGHNIGHVLVRSDNVVFFSTDAAASYQFSTSVTDASTVIQPMLDTGDYVLSEKDLTRLYKWWLTNEQTGTPAGTLDVTVYVNGASVGSYANMTKTATRLSAGFPIVGRQGQRIRFKFNTNGSKASWNSLTIHEIGFEYDVVERGGDAGAKSMTYRRAQERDLEQITELCKREGLQSPNLQVCFVAENEGKIVGFINMALEPEIDVVIADNQIAAIRLIDMMMGACFIHRRIICHTKKESVVKLAERFGFRNFGSTNVLIKEM